MKKWLALLVIVVLAGLGYAYRDELAVRLAGPPVLIDQEPQAFRLWALDRQLHSLEDYRGKVVVIDVWATWCTDCPALLAKIEKLHRKYGARGVAVLTLNIDSLTEGQLSPDQVAAYVRERGLTVPVLLASSEAMHAYASAGPGVVVVPQTYVLDRSLRIRYKAEDAKAAEVEAVIRQLLRR